MCLAVLSKADHMCTLWPSNYAYVHLKTCTKVFTDTLFMLTKIGKLKSLSVVEWINVSMNHMQIVGFTCQIVQILTTLYFFQLIYCIYKHWLYTAM